jgi:small subunit ribosomal protein S14
MAKKSSIEKNKRREKLTKQYAERRAKLKALANDKNTPMEERFAAALKLAELPRNSSATRIHNRCECTGRPKALLPQAQDEPHRAARARLQGHDPGLLKSSW